MEITDLALKDQRSGTIICAGGNPSVKNSSSPPSELEKRMSRKLMPVLFIHPSSPFRLFWDLASLCIVLVDSIMLPFYLAYYNDAPTDWWFWAGTLFFSVDIVLNFVTGYIAGPLELDHGQLVTDKKREYELLILGGFFGCFWAILGWWR